MSKRYQPIPFGKTHGPPPGHPRNCANTGAGGHASPSEPSTRRLPVDSAATPLEPALDTAGNTGQPELELLTLAEVARMLRVSERTVRRRIKDGSLRKLTMQGRLVRISLDDLRRISGNPTAD